MVAVVMMRSNEKRQKTIPRGSPSHFQSAVVCLRPLFFFFELFPSISPFRALIFERGVEPWSFQACVG